MTRAAGVAALLVLLVAPPAHAVPPSQRAVFGLSPADNLGPGGTIADGVIRGAFKPVGSLHWVKDLVTSAHADERGVSYTISPKAFWYWGGRKIPVTWRDFVATYRADESKARASRADFIDLTHFSHRGLRHVRFFWRTTGCTDELRCGPDPEWQFLFYPLLPSFGLENPSADTLWQNCICGSDGKPIANGPFYLASYSASSNTAVLKRNPYWGGHRPALSEVDLRSATDYADAVRTGTVDATSIAADATIDPILHAPGVVVQWSTGPILEELMFRFGNDKGAPSVTSGSSNELLRAPWMRHAIALATDRRAIVTRLFGDFAQFVPPVDDLLVHPSGPGYQPHFAQWDYSPARALSLLKAHCTAGTGPTAPDPANTKIWRCAGLPAIFRWTWRADRPDRTTTEEMAKAELRAVGIQIVDRPLPFDTLSQVVATGDFDIIDVAWFTLGNPEDFASIFQCRADMNWTGFCSAKFDALFKAAGASVDPGQRIEDYAAADRILAQAMPAFPLYAPPNALIRKATLLGLDPGTPLLTIEDWHWKH